MNQGSWLAAPLLAASLLAPAAAAAPAAPAAASDVQAFLQKARELPAPAAVAPKWGRHMHWLTECRDVSMAPAQSVSARFDLFSTEMVEECDLTPGGGMRCFPTFGMTSRRSTQLKLVGRPASAPTESFKVCLTGSDLNVEYISGPTRYDVSVGRDAITLTAK